jgi:hypothetical protein
VCGLRTEFFVERQTSKFVSIQPIGAIQARDRPSLSPFVSTLQKEYRCIVLLLIGSDRQDRVAKTRDVYPHNTLNPFLNKLRKASTAAMSPNNIRRKADSGAGLR